MNAHRFSIISGRQHGRTIGFRTLNLDLSAYRPTAEHWIYAGWVEIDRVRHRAAIHYGPRPVLDDPAPTLEALIAQITHDVGQVQRLLGASK